MRLLSILAIALPLFHVLASPVTEVSEQDAAPGEETTYEKSVAVVQTVYDDLMYSFKYATSAYVPGNACQKPNGNVFVKQLLSLLTDTQGFIARDDTRKEIVVAFRGTDGARDWVTDAGIAPVPFVSPGARAPHLTLAHAGFLISWNSIANDTIATVNEQLKAYPGYTIISVGHSLGGALASLAGITLKENFPDTLVRVYSYGAPRVGNPTFANWVNSRIGVGNLFRSVHTNDLVPSLPSASLFWKHHATEYWQNPDPASAATTKKCSSSGEDRTCSAGVFFHSAKAHLIYYGIPIKQTFCS